MKEKNVIGIASDTTMLLGLNGYIKEDCLVIDDVMCASRKHTLEEDCETFVHRFSLEGERMAVAAVSAYRWVWKYLNYRAKKRKICFIGN